MCSLFISVILSGCGVFWGNTNDIENKDLSSNVSKTYAQKVLEKENDINKETYDSQVQSKIVIPQFVINTNQNDFKSFPMCGNEKYKEVYNSYSQNLRHLSFKTDVLSLGGQLEVILFGNPMAKDPIPHSVYLFAGLKTTNVDVTLTNPDNNANGPDETKKPIAHFIGLGYQYRYSNRLSFGLEAKQNYFHSDRVDGYNPVIRANKHRDEAFDLKLTAAYYFPFSRRMSEFNNRWDRRQRR